MIVALLLAACGGSTTKDSCPIASIAQCFPSTSDLDCTVGHTGRSFTGSECCLLE